MADAVRFNVVMWHNETIHLKKYIMCSTLMQKGKNQKKRKYCAYAKRINYIRCRCEIPSVCVCVCVGPVAVVDAI